MTRKTLWPDNAAVTLPAVYPRELEISVHREMRVAALLNTSHTGSNQCPREVSGSASGLQDV